MTLCSSLGTAPFHHRSSEGSVNALGQPFLLFFLFLNNNLFLYICFSQVPTLLNSSNNHSRLFSGSLIGSGGKKETKRSSWHPLRDRAEAFQLCLVNTGEHASDIFLGIEVFEFSFESGGCVEQGLSWSVLLIHVTRTRAPACSTGIDRGGEILWENVTLPVNIYTRRQFGSLEMMII